jgi:hypothetical protein
MGLVTMPDINERHLTNPDWVMFDPLINPPPVGEPLMVLNEGGVLHMSKWYEGAMAWCYKPVVPASVKERMQIENPSGLA